MAMCELLKSLREKHHLTQEELAERVLVGFFNEDYCKWCYTKGQFTYTTKDALLDFLIEHMPNPDGSPGEDQRGVV